MAVKINLFLSLVILGITAHAQLSGHPQGKKSVADHREQSCANLLGELMFLVSFFFLFLFWSLYFMLFFPLRVV